MRAIILAAGFGKRMMPLTADTHKCLLKIAGRPVLSRIVDALTANNIVDLTIVSGYKAAELKEFMATNYPQHRVQWVHNEDYEKTNNIYSLALALEQVSGEDAILIECDLVFDPVIISELLEAPYDCTALLSAYEPGMDGTVVSLNSGVITAIHPPHLQGKDFVISDKFKTLNIYKFSRKFIDESLRNLTSFYAKSINNNCYYELVLGVMIYMQSNEIRGLVVDTSLWSEIDDPVDVQGTEFKFNTEERLRILNDTHGGYWNYAIEDFCYVQNAYFPPDGMISMMRHHLPLLMKSFGSSQKDLDRKLSYFIECDERKLVMLNGSSQIFPWFKDHFQGKSLLIPEPTFGEYSRMFPQASTYGDRVGIDNVALDNEIKNHDVVIFVNPNNPTGTVLESSYIEQIVLKYPEKLFVVDESFIDFSEEGSMIAFLEKNVNVKNVLVLKSLGKALGVPGLRLGFIYSNDEKLAASVRDSLPIWNVNSIAEYFMELLLKNRRSLGESFVLVKRARQIMEQKLKAIPYIEEVYPSQGNYLLARINRAKLNLPGGLTGALLERYGIYIKDVSAKFDSKDSSGKIEYCRFAVRKSDANEILLRALQDLSQAPRQ